MYGLIIAFKDYNVFKGILESPWAGLYNFELVFDFITNWDQELKDAYDNDQVVINPAYGRTLLAMDEVGSKPNDIFWKYYNAFLLGEIEPNDENWTQMKKEYWDAGYDRLEKGTERKVLPLAGLRRWLPLWPPPLLLRTSEILGCKACPTRDARQANT